MDQYDKIYLRKDQKVAAAVHKKATQDMEPFFKSNRLSDTGQWLVQELRCELTKNIPNVQDRLCRSLDSHFSTELIKTTFLTLNNFNL